LATAITKGPHHIGLTVSKLEESAQFFVSLLGWKEVRRKDEYPAIFVSDGSVMITLWATKEEPSTPFNRKRNVGLHHLALQVESEASLHEVHERLKNSGTPIEFAPELVGTGPAKHMMCFEPSGIRVEFIWRGN
jgi:catechol 2,3-dioxygenase-like lactoylglutathione lyase family enzyme